MITHLRSKHPKEYNEMQIKIADSQKKAETVALRNAKPGATAATSKAMVQYTIPEQVARIKIWDINNSSSIRIHRAIAKMIITDMEPIQVVQKTGFVELIRVLERRYTVPSRKYFSERLIPEINDEVCAQQLVVLNPVTSPFLSFTTDAWTSGNTVQSFMGLTAHWLTEHFENMSFVLDCKPFIGHHTAPALMTAFQQMLDKWNIDVGRCHVVLRDNTANISKCFCDANIDSLGCFAHTIQLCVHDGLLNQWAVSDIISIAKKLVSHFRHSSSATGRFKELQAELCLPDHQLIQDVSTRWNSTFYMLRRLCEQRRALTVYCSEVDGTYCPTAYQWSVVENVVCMLAPFEEATREVSYETAHISLVIPIVTALRNLLKNEGNDAGVRTMKSTLLKSLDERFKGTEEKPLYTVATLVDPLFKTKFFSSQATLTAAKAAILLAFNKVTVQRVSMQDESHSEHAKQQIKKIEEVPAKKIWLDNSSTSSSLLWRCINEIVQSTSAPEQQLPTNIETQLS
ncbi:zinc finger BED domain-containing protein 4-like [Hydra vulgaris]|uniref:Zinc finger BED domain-containing protein 4-like n=1 Tax=Hydra vulgaris TaxID=6087 RepID=A0ABM4BGF0_HYDVU